MTEVLADISSVLIDPCDIRLADESTLSERETEIRQEMGRRILASMPPEALSRLQIFQPAIGCLNRCNFCSQTAGPITRELNGDALRTVMGGVVGAMHTMEIEQIGSERTHKAGVIFPYLDNDIGSYRHLTDYLVGMRSMGGRTRISTVGWSRHNIELQTMHEKIATEHIDDIDGVRFSLTPYTIGWRTNREDYLRDFGNALATYSNLFEQKGVSRRTACVEVRFAPDITLDDVEITSCGGYEIIRCGDYSLITSSGGLENRTPSEITAMSKLGPIVSQPGIEAIQIIGDSSGLDEATLQRLFTIADTEDLKLHSDLGVLVQKGEGHTFNNADGNYFCFNPFKTKQNTFSGIHYYPKTTKRPTAGVMDATRPLLNHLMAIKQVHGIGPRDDFNDAAFEDIQDLFARLDGEVKKYSSTAPHRAAYIQSQVIPIAKSLWQAMEYANLQPADLFRYGLIIDTGVIVNQGKGLTEFKGLASQSDMPMTPNEEKGYGEISQSSIRGNTWRISPVVTQELGSRAVGFGLKSLPLLASADDLQLGIYEWNPHTYDNRTLDGKELRSFYIPIGDLVGRLTSVSPDTGRKTHLMPGSLRPNRSPN